MVTFENLNIIKVILGCSKLDKMVIGLRFFMNLLWVCKNRFIKILLLIFFLYENIISLGQSDMLAEYSKHKFLLWLQNYLINL